jgi:hypothetical protein
MAFPTAAPEQRYGQGTVISQPFKKNFTHYHWKKRSNPDKFTHQTEEGCELFFTKTIRGDG